MTLERMTAIVRRRYETGAYGTAVFRMAKPTLDRLRSLIPPASPPPFDFHAGALAGLFDIPVLVVDDIPVDTWELAERGGPSREFYVIESGSIGGDPR